MLLDNNCLICHILDLKFTIFLVLWFLNAVQLCGKNMKKKKNRFNLRTLVDSEGNSLIVLSDIV